MEPDIEPLMARVNLLTTAELRELFSDEEAIAVMLVDHPQLLEMKKTQEMLMVSNKSLAESNMALEPQLSQLKQSLIDSIEEASRLGETVKSLKTAVDEVRGSYKPDTILALLKTAACEEEEETEKLTESFLDGEISSDVDEFLSCFIQGRTRAHLRKVKAEKLQEIIRRGGTSTPQPRRSYGTPYYTSPYPSVPSPVSNLPYPVMYNNMPLP